MVLYFAGGTTDEEINNYMWENNCSRLFSQYNDRKCIERLQKDNMLSSNTFIDSGAFSAFTKNVTIDIDEYCDYINGNDFSVVASLDVIPKHNTIKDTEDAAQKSWDNYIYMRDHLKNPNILIPTFHKNESFRWLDNILQYQDPNGNCIEYMALGGVAPIKDKKVRDNFIRECFDHIKRINPNIKVHGFGITDLDLLEQYPFYSSDSTTWLRSAAMGELLSPYGRLIISDKRMNYDSVSIARVISYVESFGFDFERLKEDTTYRQIFNICYLKDWEKNYKCRYKKSNKKKLF